MKKLLLTVGLLVSLPFMAVTDDCLTNMGVKSPMINRLDTYAGALSWQMSYPNQNLVQVGCWFGSSSDKEVTIQSWRLDANNKKQLLHSVYYARTTSASLYEVVTLCGSTWSGLHVTITVRNLDGSIAMTNEAWAKE